MTTKMNLEWIFNDTALRDPHGYGERAAKFIKALRHPKSGLPKKQFQLDPWMERIIRRVYATLCRTSNAASKTVFMLIGRGNRETTLAAAIELLQTVGPERVPRGAGAQAATFPRLDFMVSRNHDQINSRYHETTEAACCDR
jgi:hypothetical protein